jgi:hypothetical protein
MEVSIRCVCNEDTLGADIIIYSGNSVLFVWQIMVTETGDLLSVDSRF